MQSDQRDVAFRANDAPGGKRLGDIDDLGVLDHVIARPDRWRVGRGEQSPRRLDRDRTGGKMRGVGLVGQVLAPAPAVERERRVFGFVEPHLVAGIGAILRHQGIGGDAGKKGGLVEIQERLERRERLGPTIDLSAAGVARLVGRPGLRRGRAPVRRDLKQLVAGFEGLPHAGAGIAKGLGAIGDAAPVGAGERGPVERDEGAPGEIVERGIRIGRGREHIVDAVGQNDGRDVVGEGSAIVEKRKRRSQEDDRDQRPAGAHISAGE